MNLKINIYIYIYISFIFLPKCTDTLIYYKNIVRFCGVIQTTPPTLNNESDTK